MQPCTLTRGSVSRASRVVHRSSQRHPKLLYKLYATTPGTRSTNNHREEALNSRSEILTVLHKATNSVARVLDPNASPRLTRPANEAAFWETRMSEVYNDISSTSDRPLKIVVCGLGSVSGADELVTSLLADPLSSNEPQLRALEDRWKTSGSEITIRYGVDLEATPSSIQLPSPYLTRFSVPLELTELRILQNTNDLSQLTTNSTLFDADISIIVFNPLTTPWSTLLQARLPTHSIVVISTGTPQAEVDRLIQEYKTQPTHTPRHSHHLPSLQYVAADPYRAVKAISILQSEPTSLSAIQRYQDEFIGSKVSSITQVIQSRLQPSPSTTIPPLVTLKAQSALSRIQDSLCASFEAVKSSRKEVDKAFIDVSNLEKRVQEIKARAVIDALQIEDGNAEGVETNAVKRAITQAEKLFKPAMASFTWWSMIWRVDSITGCMRNQLISLYCRELEGQLVLHTGRLARIQKDATDAAFKVLESHPTIPSAVIHNTLLQIKNNPSYKLKVNSLSAPLVARRDQLVNYPVTRLHVAGQKALLGVLAGSFTGMGIGWVAWMQMIFGSTSFLASISSFDAATIMGAGWLFALGSVRWSIGKWEKAKALWWQDWERVGEGLERDLKSAIESTTKQQVVIVAETVGKELRKVIEEREEELAKVEKDLQGLQTSLDEIVRKGETN